MSTTHLALPLAHALNIYLLDAQARNYRPSTIDNYRWRLQPFIDWLSAAGVTDLAGIDANHIRNYLVQRGAGRALTTVHTEARALRAWLNFCVREGWLSESPMRRVAMPKRPKLIRPALTVAQLRRVLKHADVRETAVVLLLLDTGLRASELCRLNADDLNLNTATAMIRQGKGAKDRQVYLSARTIKALLRYWGETGQPAGASPVFKTARGGRRFTRSTVGQIMRRLAQYSDVPGLSAHGLRRTFAVQNLRAGVDLYTLARLMGHESIDTLRQYLDLVDEDMQSAHARANVVNQL